MTAIRVEFHDGADPVDSAAALIAAAVGDGGGGLVLAADLVQARALDARLWDLGETVFLPHALSDDPHAGAASVLIAAPGQPMPARPVVLNLRAEPVDLACAHLIELIPTDEAGKVAARARWRAYQARGLKPEKR